MPLRQPWVSASGGFAVREGRLIKLETDAGLIGYGDCAPLPQAGTENLECADSRLAAWAKELPGMSPEAALNQLGAATAGAPAARCGIETAVLDLLAQQAGLSLARWLNPCSPSVVKVNAMIGCLDRQAIARALAAVKAGFSVLKLKVGMALPKEEIALLREMVDGLPPGISLRLDANCAWDMGAAEDFLGALSGLPVESVEDPLANPDVLGLSRLQAAVPFSLAADESLLKIGEDALIDCLSVRRIILKPMVQGGVLPALSLARRAQAADLECVVTTTVDSAAGTFAALHLAVAVANGLAHGLSTSAWLASDLGCAPQPIESRMKLGAGAGLGFALG
ncbi:MAG: o-succinylbenzoate synthase [Betaproteobacteria bacterium]|nr:o-succinylbenzoate synthase [Betaproteobacteria bacterium]